MRDPDDGLGFIKTSVPAPGGGYHGVARFLCVGCGTTHDERLQSGRACNPEMIAKRAERDGWQAHAKRRSRVYCPACVAKCPANDPNSELAKVIPMAKPAAAAEPTSIRDATPDQRVMIRSELDKHFDDSVGAYLDGMSDNRIAEKVGVPRIVVERIREAAYGPIRVDPEMQALRSQIDLLKGEIEGQQKGIDTLKTKVAELSSRLEKKLAVAA